MSTPVERPDEPEVVRRAPRARATASTQVRGSALLLVGRVLAMGLGLVIQLLLVRLLTKDDYGAFAWALSVVTLVQALIPLGLDRIDSRFLAVSDEQGDDRTIVGVLVGEGLVIIGLGLAAFLVVLVLHTQLGLSIAPSQTAANLLVLMVLLAPLGALDAMVLNTFATFARPRSVFYRRYLLEPGLRLSAIALVFVVGGGVFGLTVGYVVASALGVGLYAVMLVRLLREIGVLAELHGRIVVPMRHMMREGFPLLTSTLVYAATNALPPLVLGAVGTAAEVAALRAVQPVATLSLAASSTFAVLYLPLVARQWERGERHSIRITYWRTALWVAVVSYPALLVGTAFAGPTTTTLLGERYASSAPLLAIMAIGFWLQSATGFSGQVLSVSGRRRFLFAANVGSLTLGAVTALWLIPAHGAAGAAVTTTITLVGASLFRQLGLLRLPPGFVDRHVAMPYVAMLVGVVACVAVELAMHPHFVLALVISALVSVAVAAYSVPYLDVAHTFPELLRLPVLGPVLVRVARPRGVASRNPYYVSDSAVLAEPAPPADHDSGVDPALQVGSAGGDPARALFGGSGEPELEALVGAASGYGDATAGLMAGLQRHHDVDDEPVIAALDDPRLGDFAFLVPRMAPATQLGPLSPSELCEAMADVPPGSWVIASLSAARRPLGRTRAAVTTAGLTEIELYWEAPRRSRRTMLVAVARRPAMRAALRIHEGSRRGRVRAAVAVVLVRCGLTWIVTRDLVAVGRKGPA